jgi:hypothetical protein
MAEPLSENIKLHYKNRLEDSIRKQNHSCGLKKRKTITEDGKS